MKRRLAFTEGLTSVQEEIVATVHDFVDKDVLPRVRELEHNDEFPERIVESMTAMGLFGLMIPEEYGGMGESLLTHFIVAYLLRQHGTERQRSRLLPKMASGEIRAAFSMSEPDCGSDVAAIKTRAIRDGDEWVVDGQKMWLTNGARAAVVAVLVRTETGEDSPYRNMSALLLEKEPGFGDRGNGVVIPPSIKKMGYKGIETTELILSGTHLPFGAVLGGETGVGRGFYQMMDGIEVGRVNVAARGCGVALRAFEIAIAYAQQRRTFGKRIADHQAVLFSLAEMATKIEAAHQMMTMAARRKDLGERNDLEAGMAKYLAAEYCKQVVDASLRIHGGFGYSQDAEIERLYREAPMLLIGEGTSEIQKMIIGRRLLDEYHHV
jgi:alkylation response protein AidB-like acyl-CoA dehydrogenase